MAISVELGEQLEKVVEELATKGRYNSKSEVLREGVRLVHERERTLAELNLSIDRGLADARAGRGRPVDEVFADVAARHKRSAAE